MVYIYALSGAFLLAFTLIFSRSGKRLCKGLNKKEHPLRLFYGAALKVDDFIRRIFPQKESSAAEQIIKRLCVKENAKKEILIYRVKKISLCLALLFSASVLGLMYCLASGGINIVKSLTRNEYGEGTASYELDVSYNGEEATVEIDIDERLYTDDEIYELFEEAYEAVGLELLADNESAENVSGPLDLVSEYGEIDIYWEIENTDILDYNGEIAAEIEEGESITLNLYATFSLEDETALYTYPVTLVSSTLSETELLVSYILEEIEENNSLYESEVTLPEDINGEKISFFETEENNDALFLIMGVIALFAVVLLYDRKLKEKMKERESQMMIDFSEIVSKLNLLHEAGMSIYRAWERIINDYENKKEKEEHFAYQEMKLSLEKIKSGVSEKSAYEEFGRRCGLHPYIKLGNILSQNLSKGSKGMKALLNQEAESAFEERKRLARKKGEEAGTKLLIPMMLLLVVVIVIVAVPALMSIGI